ncbi:MAG: tetratricopeptide repeat protein [Bacteroidia bacterium]|jgi:tetratricopeptide (TPR) repeat protein|nr:tetratricopeptide repeat protein [Bacteroidia bacterium]
MRFRFIYLAAITFCLWFRANGQHKVLVDSLQSKLKIEKVDTALVDIYNALAWEYKNADFKQTDSLASLAIKLAENIQYVKGIGNGFINRAIVLRNQGKYQESIELARWALVQFVKIGYQKGYASVYNFIASVYSLQSEYGKAQYYYFQSLLIAEQQRDDVGVARTLNNIGVVLYEQGVYDKALTYFSKAYIALNKVNDQNGMADCLNNIGSIYQEQKAFELAIENYQRSVDMNAKIGDSRDVSSGLHNIGIVLFDQKKYAEALNYFHRSLLIDEKLGDINAVIISYASIADCYLQMKMFHAASKYANEALEMAKLFNQRKEIMSSYLLLSEIEAANGNFKKALTYHQTYKLYSDSIFNIENTSKLNLLEQQYLREKQEKEQIMATTEWELSVFKTQEKEREVTKYIFIIGLVLIIFVILIYVAFFLVRKSNAS